MSAQTFRNVVTHRAGLLKQLPIGLCMAVGALMGVGLLFIYSATNDFDNGVLAYRTGQAYVNKQVQFAAIGAIASLVIVTMDYAILARFWLVLFGFGMALLVACVVLGKEINGAKSWIMIGPFGLQVSEYCKILYILSLAGYLKIRRNLNPLMDLAIPLAMTGGMLAFILTQP